MLELSIPLGVVFHLLGMHPTVDLDDQPCLVAVEVRDEPEDHLLAAEVQAKELVAAELLPEHALCVGHSPSQVPSDP